MKKKPDWLRKARQAIDTSADALKDVGRQVRDQAREVDAKFDISDNLGSTTKTIKEGLTELDKTYALKEKASAGKEFIGEQWQEVKALAVESELDKKASRAKQTAKQAVNQNLINSMGDFLEASGLGEQLAKVPAATAVVYGKTRAALKPYYAPDTPDALLQTTKAELIYINACILQISQGEAEKLANKLGMAIASKIAGVATVGGLLGLVSTFGTAGTGTAIGTLYGAAATNATMAWVGSLVGGGMAAGAAVTGGLGLAVGVGVYTLLSSQARQFEDLSDQERRIVEATGFLIAAINDVLDDPAKQLNVRDAELLLVNTLRPVHQMLLENSDDICQQLDNKHKLLFRQHALIDYKKNVIEGFEFFINEENTSRSRYPEFAIAGVIYALLSQSAIDGSRESQLALDAIRRIKNDWNDANEAQLGAELSRYNSEQIRGIANNAKGIYHELLFVDDYNDSHSETYAELFVATNHPGADVQIKYGETDQVLWEVQLKASNNDQLVKEHFQKCPDIDVLATEEVAAGLEGCGSSGISNVEITEQMNGVIDAVADNTVLDQAQNSAAMAGLIAAGKGAIDVLSGNKGISGAGIAAAKATSVSAASTALVAYLFS
jgi:hypothetical protein